MAQHQEAVDKAVLNWQGAPMHIKAMAGAYMVPVLEALREVSQAVKRLEKAQHETTS